MLMLGPLFSVVDVGCLSVVDVVSGLSLLAVS